VAVPGQAKDDVREHDPRRIDVLTSRADVRSNPVPSNVESFTEVLQLLRFKTAHG
jgi:hypothetical protein